METLLKNGRLKSETLENLKRIVERDYGVVLGDAEAEQFGLSLLKVTRLAMGAFNRAEKNSQVKLFIT